MTLTSERIVKNFSRGARNYDKEAYVQGECAKRLVHYLDQNHHLLREGPFLEIGCGTGFVTQEIVNRFPYHPFYITDISPKMIETCQEKIQGRNLIFDTLDAELFSEKRTYSLIISGLVFQWFHNFPGTVFKLLQGLKYGGILLFSFLEAKSFPQWQGVCSDLDLPFTGNTLPCVHDLREVTNALPCVTSIWEEDLTLVYPNALQTLKSFKRIGADTPTHSKKLKTHEMKRLLQTWDARSPNGVSITYHVANVAIQRW